MKPKLNEMLMAGLSRFNTDLVVAHVGSDQELFNDLVDIMLTTNDSITLRAAWAISVITDKEPWLFEPRIYEVFDKRNSFKHPSIARFLLRYMAHVELREEKLGEIFDFSYNALNNTNNPPAIRVYAMQVLFNIAMKEPDLINELILVIESHLDTGSAGLINRGEKLIKKLKAKQKQMLS